MSDWHERQYLPSLTVANTPEIFASWRERAAQTRAQREFRGDIAYGKHPRELIDFYPAQNARACLIYIHGGYWCAFSKVETSWVADAFLDAGISVALINYPLCPEVSIADIRRSIRQAFAYLYQHVLSERERSRLVVTGHSAGGHLAAAHLATEWVKFGMPENPIAGVISLSGVFDVAPLMQTGLQTQLKLTEASARELNLLSDHPHTSAQLVVAVGGDESEEFHRQSAELAKNWSSSPAHYLSLPGHNHFTIVDDLALPTGRLHRLAVEMTLG